MRSRVHDSPCGQAMASAGGRSTASASLLTAWPRKSPASFHRPRIACLSTPDSTSSSTDPQRTPALAPRPQDEHHDIVYPGAVPFVLVHLACLAAFWTGVAWTAVALCVGLYW